MTHRVAKHRITLSADDVLRDFNKTVLAAGIDRQGNQSVKTLNYIRVRSTRITATHENMPSFFPDEVPILSVPTYPYLSLPT